MRARRGGEGCGKEGKRRGRGGGGGIRDGDVRKLYDFEAVLTRLICL